MKCELIPKYTFNLDLFCALFVQIRMLLALLIKIIFCASFSCFVLDKHIPAYQELRHLCLGFADLLCFL